MKFSNSCLSSLTRDILIITLKYSRSCLKELPHSRLTHLRLSITPPWSTALHYLSLPLTLQDPEFSAGWLNSFSDITSDQASRAGSIHFFRVGLSGFYGESNILGYSVFHLMNFHASTIYSTWCQRDTAVGRGWRAKWRTVRNSCRIMRWSFLI